MNKRAYEAIDQLILLAFDEDFADGDLSTELIFSTSKESSALLTAKADGVISGIEVAERVLTLYGEPFRMERHVDDGAFVHVGDPILTIHAHYATLLTCERTLLNFMQRMSGIATQTNQFVQATEGSDLRILDTRKTLPGMRFLDKMAVKHGGGCNHRMGLYDMVMLKDNHIKAVGSIAEAVKMVKSQLPLSIKVEVETTTLEQVQEALDAQADIIMLDNMDDDTMRQAVQMVNHRAVLEASGNMTLEHVRTMSQLGVDYVSVGALTHSVQALDISMNLMTNLDG